MKPSKTIDLSAMWAQTRVLPEKLLFSDCKTTNFYQHEGHVCGFYGFHARGKGLQYCALEADSRGAKFLPVTFSVTLEKDISARMVTPETLPDVDMFNVARASRALIDSIGDFWYSRMLEKGKTEEELAAINWRLTEKFMPEDESLVVELLRQPEFAHLRLFVYPAMPIVKTGIITNPISLGVTKKEFISGAMSPMYPAIPIEV